jgi:hypothetical protein
MVQRAQNIAVRLRDAYSTPDILDFHRPGGASFLDETDAYDMCSPLNRLVAYWVMLKTGPLLGKVPGAQPVAELCYQYALRLRNTHALMCEYLDIPVGDMYTVHSDTVRHYEAIAGRLTNVYLGAFSWEIATKPPTFVASEERIILILDGLVQDVLARDKTARTHLAVRQEGNTALLVLSGTPYNARAAELDSLCKGEINTANNLGLNVFLAAALTRRWGGTFDYAFEEGITFTLRFPIERDVASYGL